MEDDLTEDVVVTNIKMPFWSMVWFMTKWALASIPATIILFALGLGVVSLVALVSGMDLEVFLQTLLALGALLGAMPD